MEVKQEVNVYTCKEEIDNEGGNDLFDTLKIEINEEPKRESSNDTFGYLLLKENPIKTEKETYEDKLILFEEKETSEKTAIKNEKMLEKDEIVLWRREDLKKIKAYRNDGRKIYYLDETWVNAGHTKSKVWVDKSIVSSRQAFLDGLSTGLKNPSGKGKMLIICHIGSEDGFVPDALWAFESKKSGDYHEEMIGESFEKWFSIMKR
ncbi:uncharacterized protein [Diabrotica undecimpunctata]|uniref:uncharacterized protein n=1 Tax=Diabrotica undecimpunctata TaxID=50387 RepID=UPI003B63D6D4